MRDAHRSIVYSAETVVGRIWDRDAGGPAPLEFQGSHLVLPVQRRFGDADGVQRYCDAALQKVPGVPAVRVLPARGARRASWSWPGTVRIPESPWALREMVVVHELAHHVAAHTGCGDPVHGPDFVSVYRDLLERLAGPEVALLLTASLHEAGYPFQPRRMP